MGFGFIHGATFFGGMEYADSRENTESLSYKNGKTKGRTERESELKKPWYDDRYTSGYNAGVAAADARVNGASASYKQGVTDADNRANSASPNWKNGYNSAANLARANRDNMNNSFIAAYENVQAASKLNTAKSSAKTMYNRYIDLSNALNRIGA